jgi:hypothetical protein
MKLLEQINEKYKDKLFVFSKKSRQTIMNDYTPFYEKGLYGANLIPATFPASHHTLNDSYNNINWKYIDVFYKIFLEFLGTKT